MLARVDTARADRLPELGAVANEGSRMVTEGDKDMHHYPSRWQDSYRETVSLHFNLDIWGKYMRLHSSAKARARAAEAATDDMRVTTAAATAITWFRLLQLKETLAINQAMYESYSRTCRIYENRVKAGLTPELHLRRFMAAQIEEVQKQITACQGNLALLLGWDPARLVAEANSLGAEHASLGFARPIPAQVPADVPSSLMRRRPDIQGAEELLMAANENIGAAIADFFPTISLTADEGFSSAHLEKVTAPFSSFWDVLLSPAMTFFSGGRRIAAKEEADAQYREALADYKRTVSDAFRAMREALDNNKRSREVYESKRRQVEDLARSNDILEKQYQVGVTSVMDLLDVRRQLQAAQQEEAQARFEVYSAVISICRELGGGWQKDGEAGKEGSAASEKAE